MSVREWIVEQSDALERGEVLMLCREATWLDRLWHLFDQVCCCVSRGE